MKAKVYFFDYISDAKDAANIYFIESEKATEIKQTDNKITVTDKNGETLAVFTT